MCVCVCVYVCVCLCVCVCVCVRVSMLASTKLILRSRRARLYGIMATAMVILRPGKRPVVSNEAVDLMY